MWTSFDYLSGKALNNGYSSNLFFEGSDTFYMFVFITINFFPHAERSSSTNCSKRTQIFSCSIKICLHWKGEAQTCPSMMMPLCTRQSPWKNSLPKFVWKNSSCLHTTLTATPLGWIRKWTSRPYKCSCGWMDQSPQPCAKISQKACPGEWRLV